MSRIGLIGENSIQYVEQLLDIWNEGNSVVLIDVQMPDKAAIKLLKEAGTDRCFIEESKADAYPEIRAEINTILYRSNNTQAEYLPDYIYDKFKKNYSHSEAVVLYSSGTTGNSKGIILSHYAINTNADFIADYMQLKETDCMYIAKKISHSSALIGELLVALKTGTKLIIAPTIMPPRYVLDKIGKFSVTHICLNPWLLSMYTDEYERNTYNILSLKKIYVSGSILTDRIYEKAHRIFGEKEIYNMYGLSEAGPRVTAQRIDCCKSNSVGKAIRGVQIVLVDDTGKSVANGKRGIVHVNTPSRFSGYISGKPKFNSLYNEWINTGDVGYIDENGELHIVNRLDDVIINDSHKVYPHDIEKTIMENTDITECVVVNAEVKGQQLLCCLFVGNSELRNGIIPKLKSKLLAYEIPKVFICCDKLTRTSNGKIAKTMMVEKINQYFADNKNKI